jgi:hypothetical protein
MIASRLHNFIFIKTMKTAGTSIEMALSPHCGPDDILTPISVGMTSSGPQPASIRATFPTR